MEKIEAIKRTIKEGRAGNIGRDKVMTFLPEINVRGMTVEEAIEVLDKFIDDAAIAGIGEVTIIHGKGTGALRSGIHKYLKSNGSIKSFRLGEYGEGDSGVTVVILK